MKRLSMTVLALFGLGFGALAAEPETTPPSDEAKPHMGKGAAPTTETPTPAAKMDKGQAPTTETPPPSAHMGKGEAPH